MSWKIRHEGSPQHAEVATAQEVMHGLLDGLWETTDEVQGPNDAKWVPLENHPQFAEAAADIEPLPKMREDESKLDMTALIDVCLVLLIFFILTTSYSQLQARIDHPTVADDNDQVPVVTQEQIDKQMIRVTVRLEKGKPGPIIRIEDKVVDEKHLGGEFQRIKKGAHKTTVLLIFDGDVTNGTLTTIEDAAAAAGIDRVNWGVGKEVK